MAIEYHQKIIKNPSLSPNSLDIVKSYLSCGDLFIELEDMSEALMNYTTALNVLHEHHPSDHPMTGEIHLKIGKLFEKVKDKDSAMKSYEQVITFNVPETTNQAYRAIGWMYCGENNYDMARVNFIEGLTHAKHAVDSLANFWVTYCISTVSSSLNT